MIVLRNYSVNILEHRILDDISLTFEPAKIYAILGHNGSGKSSFVFSLFRHPRYSVSGQVEILNKDILSLSPHNLVAEGMFLSFQNIPEIPGIKLIEYLRTVYNTEFKRLHPLEKEPSLFVFRRMVEKILPTLGLESKVLDRDLFVGFSGGEKRRVEMLQIELLQPRYIFLDEIDSGLDIDAIEALKNAINRYKGEGKTVIMITHNFHLLDDIEVDEVIVLKGGKIEKKGSQDLLQLIRKTGFQ